MLNKQHTCIFFDAVGTLLTATPPVLQVYRETGEKHGVILTEEEIKDRFHEAYHNHFPLRFDDNITSEELEKQRWENVVTDVFGSEPVLETELFTELWNHFALPESWAINKELSALMNGLAQADWNIGIASNFDFRLVDICARHFPYIKPGNIFYSSDIGYSKPDIRFYKSIMKNIDSGCNRFIMVGDDKVRDVDAPLKLEWDAYHVDEAIEKLSPLLDI